MSNHMRGVLHLQVLGPVSCLLLTCALLLSAAVSFYSFACLYYDVPGDSDPGILPPLLAYWGSPVTLAASALVYIAEFKFNSASWVRRWPVRLCLVAGPVLPWLSLALMTGPLQVLEMLLHGLMK